MKKIIAVIGHLLISTQTSFAQPITVRSGEHQNFTRLVLYIQPGTQWTIEKPNPGGPIINLNREDLRFNTTNSFDRITNKRIVGITDLGDGKLYVELACKCTTDAFELNGNLLVVDIKDQDTDSTIETEIGGKQIFKNNIIKNIGMSRVQIEGISEKLDYESATRRNQMSDINQFRSQLEDQMARAIASGSAVERQPKQNGLKPNREPKEKIDLSATLQIRNQEKQTIKLENSTENRQQTLSVSASECPLEMQTNLVKFEHTKNLPSVLSESFGSLYEEFDELSQPSALSFVQSLLYYGFGAEAREVLNLYIDKRNPFYFSVSYALDLENDPTGYLQDKIHCDGNTSLWAILSNPPSDLSGEPNINKLIIAFESLPNHLKTHLGPRLADKLTEMKVFDGATSIIQRVERIEGKKTPLTIFASSNSEFETSDYKEALEILENLISEDILNVERSLPKLIEYIFEKEKYIDEKMAETVATVATEMRHHETNSEMWRADILAKTILGNFNDAFDALADNEGRNDEVTVKTKEDLWLRFSKTSSDGSFLLKALAQNNEEIKSLKSEVANSVADRLLNLGFPNQALQWITVNSSGTALQSDSLLKAKSFLKMKKPEEVNKFLTNQTSIEALQMRAKAFKDMQEYVNAAEVYGDLEDVQAAATAMLLSRAADNSEQILALPFGSAISELLRQLDEKPPSENVTLSQSEQLFDQSRRSRNLVETLLIETELSN